jgi:hypothetical protein
MRRRVTSRCSPDEFVQERSSYFIDMLLLLPCNKSVARFRTPPLSNTETYLSILKEL